MKAENKAVLNSDRPTRVMIVEDEYGMNRGIAFSLERAGFQAIQAFNLEEGRNLMREEPSDIYICDINLPDGSGLDFVREVRALKAGRRPYIICLTALDTEADYVIGYEAGVDDYVAKPFSLSVLILKLEAYEKRLKAERDFSGAALGKKTGEASEYSREDSGRQCLSSGNICFDTSKMEVSVDGAAVSLTKNEIRLLNVFLKHPKALLSRNQLLELAFDLDGRFVDENTLAVNISRLREKLGDDAQNPQYIKNVRGLGYLWMKEVQ